MFDRVLALCEKLPNTEFLLFRIFPHSGWIRRDTEYLSVVSPNVGKYWPEKAQYCALFKQCGISRFCFYCLGSVLDSAMVWRVLPKIWKNTRVWENSYIVGLYKELPLPFSLFLKMFENFLFQHYFNFQCQGPKHQKSFILYQ